MLKLKKILAFVVVVALPLLSAAQCSVCKAGVESSLRESGSNVAKGINGSILYLMAFPYLIFTGFIIYRYREFIAYQFRSLVQKWRMFRASH